mmetsp:Transcript_21742/g.66920  ORF Transcript_21742/g.66920 Transcript_21742/m.66920 type:complete len:273 (+) Transcript_21742:75-893(+)
MSALVGKAPHENINSEPLNFFEKGDECGNCWRRLGCKHARHCVYSLCRRSGLTTFGGTSCYCYLGPDHNYLNGRAIREADRSDAGRVDPPGSRVVPHAGKCQRDVVVDGFLPDELFCYATGLTVVAQPAYMVYVDPDEPGAMGDCFSMIRLKNNGALIWNSARLQWQWNNQIAAYLAARSPTRELARGLILCARGRGTLNDDCGTGVRVLHALVNTGRGDVAGLVLACFKGEARLAFYGVKYDDVFEPPFSDNFYPPPSGWSDDTSSEGGRS